MEIATDLLFALLMFAALGSGLMSGLFFVFSNFAMKAFAALPPAKGIAAMQSINLAILNPLFLSIFLGTGAVSLYIAIHALMQWQHDGAEYLLTGSALYLIGCILITMIFNVPRNDALATLDPDNPESEAPWRDYLVTWTKWNHIRTLSTLAAAISFTFGISQFYRVVD